jgi:hypothetical protein
MTGQAYRIVGWLLIVLALFAIGAGFPVDGLAGAGLSLGGIVVIWVGWYLVVRKGATR